MVKDEFPYVLIKRWRTATPRDHTSLSGHPNIKAERNHRMLLNRLRATMTRMPLLTAIKHVFFSLPSLMEG
jgi:hypothetical protein